MGIIPMFIKENIDMETKFIYNSYSLRLNHFLNSLIQYANFFQNPPKKRPSSNSFLYNVHIFGGF